MLDVVALGELLIDFAPLSADAAGYPALQANPGGAPGNFLAALAACGKRTIVVRLGAAVGRWGYFGLGLSAVVLCLTLLAGGKVWTALLPVLYLPLHVATWRKMVRIDHGEELNVCLGETARNIWIFGLLLTLGILLG